MTGGTRAHAAIIRNLAVSLTGRLREKSGNFLGSDLKIEAAGQAHQTLCAKNKRKDRTLRAISLRQWAKLTKGSSGRSRLEWSAEGQAKPSNHSSKRVAALLPFLNHYNYHQPHFGINGCPRSQGSRKQLSRHES